MSGAGPRGPIFFRHARLYVSVWSELAQNEQSSFKPILKSFQHVRKPKNVQHLGKSKDELPRSTKAFRKDRRRKSTLCRLNYPKPASIYDRD